ncbi:MAG TPA: site-2 protease family protein [Acidimicrobiales bacterium]
MLTHHQEAPGLQLNLAGVPVRLEWTFLVFTVLIGVQLGEISLVVAWVVVVTLSILVHELGHAAAFRSWGVHSRIVLHTMGGVTIPTAGLPHRRSRIAVSLAGPFAGLLLFGVPALVIERTVDLTTPWDDVVAFAVWVNIGWALINLLPILPLDGGHVALELIDAATDEQGEVPTRWLSIVVAAGAGLWALSEGFLFGALFAVFFLADNVRALQGRRESGAAADLRPAAEALERGDPDAALGLAGGVLGSTRDPRARAMAIDLTAWAHLAKRDLPAAAAALALYPDDIEPSGHLRAFIAETTDAERVNATVDAWLDHRYLPATTYTRCLVESGLADVVGNRLLASRADGAERARLAFQHTLFVAGQMDASARFGERLVEAGGADPIVAYNVACAHSRAGRTDAAVRWLGTAIDQGFTNRELLDNDPDLARVRTDPRFAMLRNRLPA